MDTVTWIWVLGLAAFSFLVWAVYERDARQSSEQGLKATMDAMAKAANLSTTTATRVAQQHLQENDLNALQIAKLKASLAEKLPEPAKGIVQLAKVRAADIKSGKRTK